MKTVKLILIAAAAGVFIGLADTVDTYTRIGLYASVIGLITALRITTK